MEKRKLTRRDFLRLSAAAATGAIVAACAPAAPEVIEVEKEVPVEKVVIQTVEVEKVVEKEAKPAKLVIDYWDPWGAGYEADWKHDAVQRWNADHPEVQVRMTFVPTSAGSQMSEKLLTNIAAGTPPECAWFDRFGTASWAAEGSLMDLTEYAAATEGFAKEEFFPFAWIESNYKGKMYSIPYDTDDRAIYYNKDHFKEAGLDPSEEAFPTSIEEFDEIAEKLTIGEAPRYERIGFVPWVGQGWIYSYGWTWDGKFYDPETLKVTANDPKIVAACEWMVSYADKYGIENIETFSQAFGGEAQEPLIAGLVSMEYNGDWMIRNFRDYGPDLDYGVVPMPWPEGGRKATWAGGWSMVIPMRSPHPDAAWEFIAWYASPEMEAEYCKMSAHIPTHVKYHQDPEFVKDPKHKVFMDLLPIADCRPPLPVGNLLWDGLAEGRDLIIHGIKTPKEALDDVADRCNKGMEKYL